MGLLGMQKALLVILVISLWRDQPAIADLPVAGSASSTVKLRNFCVDLRGNRFPTGALYYHDKQIRCLIHSCKKDGVSQLVLDLCASKNTKISSRTSNREPSADKDIGVCSSSDDHAGNMINQSVAKVSSTSNSCHVTWCERGRTVNHLNIFCQPAHQPCPLHDLDVDQSCCDLLPFCESRCVPIMSCPHLLQHVLKHPADSVHQCQLINGEMGVICLEKTKSRISAVPNVQHPHRCQQLGRAKFSNGARMLLSATPAENAVDFDIQQQLREAVGADGGARLARAERRAQRELNALPAIENCLQDNGKIPAVRSSTGTFGLNFRNSPKAHRQGRVARVLSRVSQFLLQDNLTDIECTYENKHNCQCVAKNESPVPFGNNQCRVDTIHSCDPTAVYRTADGTCNNLQHPLWGSSTSSLRRIFDNRYADGISQPTSFPGQQSARYVSDHLFSTISHELQYQTIGLTFMGQLIDHDISHSPISRFDNGQEIECCIPPTQPPPSPPIHPFCFPIEIDPDDSFYSTFGQRCMNFVRSVFFKPVECNLGPAEQVNDITHFLDGSQVYGSTKQTQMQLRTLSGGQMKTSPGNLLPLEVPMLESESGFTTSCRGCTCFIAGDTRVNENPILTLYHTLLVREHNRIASHLEQAHPLWNDERLFQESRRILVAQYQHIVYNEWLPSLIGFGYSEVLGLRPLNTGFSFTYLETLFPNIANEFSTAAFRLHTLLQGIIEYVSSSGVKTSQSLADSFFDPITLTSSSLFMRMARGTTTQPPQRFDHRFTRAVAGNLFTEGEFGMDLASLNIQRGRDHGIVNYVTVFQWCTGKQVNFWHDLLDVMPKTSVDKLKSVYPHWIHVELFVGLNLETPVLGGVVGTTSRCLIAEQFLRLRYADRFFYDLAGQPGSFSAAQLFQIRRSSWAAILCNNVGADFTHMQRFAFYQALPFFNPIVNCSDILASQMNLIVF